MELPVRLDLASREREAERLGADDADIDPGLVARAQGSLLGQLAGDSLGSLVEFRPGNELWRAYPCGLRELQDGGTWQTIAGQPTDDSELALMLARSIVASGGYDREAVARAYVFWYRSGPFDCGTTTGRALGAVTDADLVAGRAAERMTKAASRTSQANGSLMRVSPLGIWGHSLPPDELAGLARADSVLTHPHSVCQEACAVYTVATARAIASGASAPQVYGDTLAWSEHGCRESAVLDALRRARDDAPDDYSTHAGWVLVAFQNAFYQLLHAPSLEEGVVASVMAGGDTDTNAAIAGALLGAVHGLGGVPARWREAVLACQPLAGKAGVRHPRPEPFWPVDALQLAAALLPARP